MPHPFLSPEWVEGVRDIRDRYAGRLTPPAAPVRLNQTVTGVPFGEGTLSTYVDTTSGTILLDVGTLPDADASVVTDYDTARQLFVDLDLGAAMQAFMAGRIKVQGDMMKLMALQAALPNDDLAREIADEIRRLTA